MTCHAADGTLLPKAVGFDYQRTMVAAAAALARSSSPFPPAAISTAASSPQPHRTLLVGLGAGSCAAALAALLCSRSNAAEVAAVEVAAAEVSAVEIDEGVVSAAEAADPRADREAGQEEP